MNKWLTIGLGFSVPFKISTIYAIFSALWILLSDQILYFFVKTPEAMTKIQMMKGWAFVFITALIIFFLLKKEIKALIKTQAALHESEEIFNCFMENSPIYIFFKDKDIRSIRLSKNYEQMIGRPLNEILGKTMDELFPSELAKKMIADDQRTLNESKLEIVDEEFNGRYYTTTKFPIIIDGQPRYLCGYTIDITEQKRAETALRESQEKLIRSKKMESLGLLAGGVAHDLNNVLAGIVSLPEVLLLHMPEDSDLRKPIEIIQQSGNKATAIVQDLLTIARGIAIQKQPLNLNDVINSYLTSPEHLKTTQYHPSVNIKTSLDSKLLQINGSMVHINKALMNLVSNACESIKGSGEVMISTVNCYIDKPLKRYGDIKVGEYAVLSINDNGPGISPDDLDRIFEPFYSKKVMGRSGTGLGLAVVWNVLQDHNGYIDVISGVNGTQFKLYFPINREEFLEKDNSLSIDDLKGNGETILVIDDVESQRLISCQMLEVLGYKTKAVSSGEKAVEYLKDSTVDLILLDMIMDPGINGFETYENIIKIHPDQKALIVSGFAHTEDIKATQRLGAGKFLKKPLTLQMMGMAVKEELNKKSAS